MRLTSNDFLHFTALRPKQIVLSRRFDSIIAERIFPPILIHNYTRVIIIRKGRIFKAAFLFHCAVYISLNLFAATSLQNTRSDAHNWIDQIFAANFVKVRGIAPVPFPTLVLICVFCTRSKKARERFSSWAVARVGECFQRTFHRNDTILWSLTEGMRWA